MTRYKRNLQKQIRYFNKIASHYRAEGIIAPRLSYRSKRLTSIKKKLRHIYKDFPNCAMSLDFDSSNENLYNVDGRVYPFFYPEKKVDVLFYFSNGDLGKGVFGVVGILYNKDKEICATCIHEAIKYKDMVKELYAFQEKCKAVHNGES
jgi:hypothetical protein